MDMASLVADGQLADLKPLLDAPALDTPGKTVRETLIPGTQDTLVFDGVQRGINFVFTGYGHLLLAEAVQGQRLDIPRDLGRHDRFQPPAQEGRQDRGVDAPGEVSLLYPNMVLWSLIYSAGGNDLVVKIDNLEPDIWKDRRCCALRRATMSCTTRACS